MLEAVIVAADSSPIGPAFKGALASTRPDDPECPVRHDHLGLSIATVMTAETCHP